MISQSIWLSIYLRTALLLFGIAFLGTVSAPIQAADNPPSTWDRLFGGDAKAPEIEQKKPKPKKTKLDKQPLKVKPSKTAKTASTQTNGAAEPIREPEHASFERISEKPVSEPEKDSSSSIGSFFRGVFGSASSSPPWVEGGSQSEAPKTPISTPNLNQSSPSESPVTPINSPKTAIPAETNNPEPFWKRVFGAASSQPLETKVEPSAQAIPVPLVTSRTSAEEESSPSQQLNNRNDNQSIALPAQLAINPNTPDTKANFSLSNVCDRQKCELMILYDAPITKANVEKFTQSTASIPAGSTVLFNSTDGDLNSGIKLGQVLRQKRFHARIGRTKLNNKTLVKSEGQCFSACTLAFAGGISRQIDPNDQIGIYALRSSTKTVNENEMRTAINALSIYLDQMGVDRRLVDQMLQVKGSAVSIMSMSNAKLLNLDNSHRSATYPWRMQALDDGLLIALVSEKQASGNFNFTLGLNKQNKELRLTIYIKPFSESLNLNQLSDFLNRNTRLKINYDNQTISPSLIKPWEATGSGIQTAVLLSEKELLALSSTLQFEIELGQINRNPYNLDGITIFGTQGLKGALATIKK